MRTCQYAGTPFSEPRSHPWTTSASDPDARYHDLTTSPALIRTALEDKTLQAELPGYAEYAQKTRYRLFPGIW